MDMCKILIAISIIIGIIGCTGGRNTPPPESTNYQNEAPENELHSGKYTDHFLSCRHSNPEHLKNVITKAQNAEKGVILYFHGGLSDEPYVRKQLGPALMESIFIKKNTEDYYPIFINYNAGIFDFKNSKYIEESSEIKDIQQKIGKRIDKEVDEKLLSITIFSEEEKLEKSSMSILINAGSNISNLKSNFTENTDDKNAEFVSSLLINETLLQKFSEELLIKEPDLALAAESFSELAQELDSDQSLTQKSLTSIASAKVITKILARFALKINHQVQPTIFEEVVRGLSLLEILKAEDILQFHWTKVKRHSDECWKDNNDGWKLVTALFETKKQKEDYHIHLLSHSAGSLVIGKLVEKLGKTNIGKIDKTRMIVPAISLELFSESIRKYPKHAGELKAYVLSDKYEKKDNVGRIYRASLLYAVSGLGEKTGFGDKPLMLERHLGKLKSYPYNTWWYRSYFKEDVRPVWRFFEGNPSMINYYPFDESYSGGASHECSKYPWKVKDLSKKIMADFTGLTEDAIEIRIPQHAPSC
jgi:hypothetical protein